MTEENTGAPEPTEEVQETESRDEQPESTEETEEQTQRDEESEKLKALLEKEKEAWRKATKDASDAAFKLRERTRQVNDSDNEPTDDSGFLTEERFEERLQLERKVMSNELQASRIKDITASLSGNQIERELIEEVYKNRTFPANLTLEEKLGESFLIARKDKIFLENDELKRTVASNRSATSQAPGAHHDPNTVSEPKMAGADRAMLLQAGWKWNGKRKVYEKKLTNGDVLVRQADGSAMLQS